MPSSGETDPPIVIAGAGIGGLTAALALARNGHDILILEKARALAEVGAGLQLSPNACSVLDRLGLLPEVSSQACAPEKLGIWSGKTGERIGEVSLGAYLKKRHGYPFLVTHRADLQRALLSRVEATPGITLRLASEVRDVDPAPFDTLTCIYQTDSHTASLSCKAVIGADGVWSKTRRLIPQHENAHFSGQVAYRALVPIAKVPEKWTRNSALWLHKDTHLVHYPVRGGRELNIVALTTEAWEDETWSAKADKPELLRTFQAWPAEIRNLLHQPETWLKWALCRVDASGPWTHGHVALLGDAAHAMLPYMAQGAAMSIEDAQVLAAHLPGNVTNIPAALRAYEAERKARVKPVQTTADRNAFTFHASGPTAFARDTFLRLSSPERLANRFDSIYGWSPVQDSGAGA